MLERLLMAVLRRTHALKVSWNQRGLTAVEYGLIVALVATVTITAAMMLDSRTSSVFSSIADRIGG